MATVSPTQIAPNGSITSSGVNTPINQLAAAINGGLDDNNISSLSGTKLTAGTTPASAMTTAANPETRFLDVGFDFVASGCVWSGDAYGSTRAGSMTAGVVYINGVRIVVNAVSAHTFTASKDTYVDIDNTGTISYNEANNNAASPALASNSLRLAIIVTGAGNIAAAGSVNQGQENKVLPIASSIPYTVTDSLGNLICPRDPNRRTLGYRTATAALTSLGTSSTLMPGMTMTVSAPTARKLRIDVYIPSCQMSVAGAVTVELYNSATVTGSPVQSSTLYMPTSGTSHTHRLQFETTLSGTQSFCVGIKASTAGSGTIAANATGFVNELRVGLA